MTLIHHSRTSEFFDDHGCMLPHMVQWMNCHMGEQVSHTKYYDSSWLQVMNQQMGPCWAFIQLPHGNTHVVSNRADRFMLFKLTWL